MRRVEKTVRFSLRSMVPNSVGQGDNHDNGDKPKNDHAVAGIFGQIFRQGDINDSAENRSLNSADAADDNNEDNGNGPFGSEAAGRENRAAIQIEDGAGYSGEKPTDNKAEQSGAKNIDAHTGRRIGIIAHGVKAQSGFGLQQRIDNENGNDGQ